VPVAVEFEAERERRGMQLLVLTTYKNEMGRERGRGSHTQEGNGYGANGAFEGGGDWMVAIVMRNAAAHGLFEDSMRAVWGG
jgi:hypothetical protein